MHATVEYQRNNPLLLDKKQLIFANNKILNTHIKILVMFWFKNKDLTQFEYTLWYVLLICEDYKIPMGEPLYIVCMSMIL